MKEENRELFEQWVQKVRENGFEEHIQRSVEIAVAAYYTNPSPLALEYIAKLNDSAVKILLNPECGISDAKPPH